MILEPGSRTFSKEERLCSKKMIERLFLSGSSIIAYPLRLQYILIDSDNGDNQAKVMFSVSKKRFKSAVKRNLVKRRTREAYRLNKHFLYKSLPEGKQLLCTFIYIDDTIQSHENIVKATLKAINRYRSRQENETNDLKNG